MKRWLVAIGGLALAAAVLLVASLLWYRQAIEPLHEGTLVVGGPQAPVDIRRDEHGIPTIDARSEHDAYFALGFVHAQDRLWQMEFNRRIAAGRLAEILGPSALPSDQFLRALGVRRAAQRAYEALDAEHRGLIDAYVAGVNAQFAARTGPLPPEFVLTRAPAPEPWTPSDCIAWSLMMAWDLASNSMRMEMRRLRLATVFSRAEIDDVYQPQSDAAPGNADFVDMYRVLGLLAPTVTSSVTDDAIPVAGFGSGDSVGSNNWVLSGKRTVSGKPLLANDPHLGLTAPSVWYFATLHAPGLAVTGATLPGVPGVVLGRNDRVAWGFTNTGADQQDLYIERINPEDGGEYETPEGWRRFGERVERFGVQGAADVELVVRETRHGPVISDLPGIAKHFRHTGHALALRWAALEPGDRTVAAIRALNRARSVADAERALADFNVVTQSVVLADSAGAIGFVVTGRIPARHAQDDLRGIAPAPGWDARYDWQGFLPYAEVPREFDPATGYVATANHYIAGPGYPHHLGFDWAAPYRRQRIVQLIGAREKHDVGTMQAIQGDIVSQPAQRLMLLLAAAQPTSAAARDALTRLTAWDGTMAADRPEPLLFHAWRRALTQRIFNDDFGDLAAEFVATADLTPALLRVLEGATTGRDWCDDRGTPHRAESCTLLMTETLEETVARLAQASGRDVAGLRWGEAHIAIAEHRPFSSVAALTRLFELRTPVPGDTHTVNATALSYRADLPFSTRHASTLRAIVDLAQPDQSLWVQATGQSGNPLSPHYASLLPLWRDVRYVPMRAAPREAPLLQLRPRS